MLQHPGLLVTKQQVLDTVWPGTFVGDAVLKDNIRQLREALEDDAGSATYIETAHRRGYRFIGKLDNPAASNNSGAAAQALPGTCLYQSVCLTPTDTKVVLTHQAAKFTLEARFGYVPFRLSLLLSHRIGDRPRRTEIVDGASNIHRQQLDHLRNWLSHLSVWLYSSEPDLHLSLCV